MGVKLPPPYFTPRGKKKSPSAVNNPKTGAAHSVQRSVPPCSRPGGSEPPLGLCPDGEIQPPATAGSCCRAGGNGHGGRGLSAALPAASGTWPCCKPPFWGTPSPCSSPHHAEVTLCGEGMQRACPSPSQPHASRVTGQDSPVPWHACSCAQRVSARHTRSLCPESFQKDGGTRWSSWDC